MANKNHILSSKMGNKIVKKTINVNQIFRKNQSNK